MESDNKLIQRKRMMSYFIKATEQVVEAEGVDKVTIRKVARLAAYNSATLYNYFEDLDHLLFFTLMKYLKDYTLAFSEATKKNSNPMELLHSSWSIFSHYAFSRSSIYYNLFFNKHSSRLSETVTEYYNIFPEELGEHPHVMTEMLRQADIFKRNHLLLSVAIGDKISREELEVMNRIMVYTFESMLRARSAENDIRPPNEAVDEMMGSVEFLLRSSGLGNLGNTYTSV